MPNRFTSIAEGICKTSVLLVFSVCDSYLKEGELQKHLFDYHRAQTLDEYFVKINSSSSGGSSGTLYICVVCWAKIPTLADMASHRNTCKIDQHNGTGGNDAPVS